MWLSILAAALAVFVVFVNPFARPLYATAPVDVGNFEITAGGEVDRFLQIPPALAAAVAVALLAAAVYVEFFAKLRVGGLPKVLALLALAYAVPLPYLYLVKFSDVVVVVSNFAMYLSLPMFGLALLVAVTENLLVPRRRARVIADLSVTEEKTERGT
ncbi:hypothetical protein [Pyrobaculum neutrophilum]|uniref:Uncharacterized protein n=1 Tax=Pyrobaculum neutrophilum (strain DSM 2338 / JCM 9278 / NBRC 100436 / V24Sta) TaxID=444157 RepID=B1Y9Q4_PYRNV|nr:hypothetical protein [Pyrobaculum neutrophilum]ACB38976.1 conserved hypothetical protein [Pyrobaculum neutrophilum V24Sta]